MNHFVHSRNLYSSGIRKNGTFSEYVVTKPGLLIPIPDTWTSIDAAQVGLAPLTALQALCHTLPGLPSPLSPVSVEQSFPILVYGASTSVGLYAVQFAHLAGLRVIATASPKNFDLVRQFGASEVFDYRDPELVSKIRQASHGTLRHAVDTVASGEAPQRVVDVLEVGDGENQGYIAAVMPYESVKAGVNVTFGLVFELLGEVISFRNGANTKTYKDVSGL
jgi:NADPH:quinone reductase-like Zn-dependent oxidoreductase